MLSTSRYLKTIDTKDDVVIPVSEKGMPFVSKQTYKIISVEGDTFDKIAARVLLDSTQWWKIAGLNPHVYFPDSIPTGTTIIVPSS